MARLLDMLTFALCFLLVNSFQSSDNSANVDRNSSQELSAFVAHLNSVPVKLYNYRQPTIQRFHKKSDIYELTVDLFVDCVRTSYPDLPCEDTILTCDGYVQNTAGEPPKVLGEIKCEPKVVNTPPAQNIPDILITPPQFIDYNAEGDVMNKQSVALSNEAVSSSSSSSESGERFVAMRRDSVLCVGCPFDLNTAAQGIEELTDLGIAHIESENDRQHSLVKVLRLQQQVVAGIKYILLAEIAPTVCSKYQIASSCPLDSTKDVRTCQITFLQKPWLDKTKQIIANNCTVSQEFTKPVKANNEMDNEIDVINVDPLRPKPKPAFSSDNFDQIAQSGRIDDDLMTPSRLSDLESQILSGDPPKSEAIDPRMIVEAVEAFEAATHDKVPPIVESVEVFTSIPVELDFMSDPQSDQPTNTESTSESSSMNVKSDLSETTTSSESNSSESSEEDKRPKRAIRQLVKISPEEKPFIKDLADYAAAALDNIDDDNHRRVVLQILGAKRTIGDHDGTTYKLILRMGISKCLESKPIDSEFNCRDKLFEHYTKICKVQVHVDDDNNSNPKIVKSQCQNIKRDKDDTNKNRTNYSRYKRQTVGGSSAVDTEDDEVGTLIALSLKQLDGTSSHDNKFKIKKIKSASRQVVSGTLWRIKASVDVSDCPKSEAKEAQQCGTLEGSEASDCDFVILDQPWRGGPQYDINVTCDDVHTTHSFRAKRNANRPLLGGLTQVDKSDPRISEYLTGGLAHLDSQNSDDHKLTVVNVLSVTKQIVSGTLFRIEAEVALSECSKNDQKDLTECKPLEEASKRVCNFKIWDQPWLPNGRQTNITCQNDETQHSFRSKRSSDRSMPGGITKGDKNDPIVSEYLKGGLGHLDSKSSDDNRLTVVNVLSVTKQVVSGTLFRIEAEVALSDCSKNDQKDFTECKPLEEASKRVCNFKIWDQPWLPNGRQTNITCENDETQHSFRSKRSVDSPSKKNRNDLMYSLFELFTAKYGKVYSNKEQKARFRIFNENMDYVRFLNENEQGTAMYGVTEFADLTREEFSFRHGLREHLRSDNDIPLGEATIPDIDLPVEFDWRKKGAVSEVKNQGQCGSCWAFSVTGNIEGQYAIKHSQLLEFSEQELVDCDKTDQGCNGGLMDNAYRTIEKIGGLETESDYPYDAEDETCHFNKTLARVQVTGAVNISQDEKDMAKWLVANGPISIAINANAMQFYVGGVSHPWKFLCNPKNLDHGVLIVGYGVHKYPLLKKTLPYWIVKNSWGPSWGEQGYYRVYRGDGTCGVNQTPSSAIVA